MQSQTLVRIQVQVSLNLPKLTKVIKSVAREFIFLFSFFFFPLAKTSSLACKAFGSRMVEKQVSDLLLYYFSFMVCLWKD
jgi:hypothetical protein